MLWINSLKVANYIHNAWTGEWSMWMFARVCKYSVTELGLLEAWGLFFWRASANLGIPQIVSHQPSLSLVITTTLISPIFNFFALCNSLNLIGLDVKCQMRIFKGEGEGDAVIFGYEEVLGASGQQWLCRLLKRTWRGSSGRLGGASPPPPQRGNSSLQCPRQLFTTTIYWQAITTVGHWIWRYCQSRICCCFCKWINCLINRFITKDFENLQCKFYIVVCHGRV